MTGRPAAAALATAIGLTVSLAPSAASAHTFRPGAPSGLHVVKVTSSSFTVASKPAPHATRYRLFASTTRSNLFVQNIRNAQRGPLSKSPRVRIGHLTGGSVPYYYRVEALNQQRWKFSGTIGEVGLRPAAPANVHGRANAMQTFVTWTPSQTASGYSIEQSTSRDMSAHRKVFNIRGNTGSYTPYGLKPGKTYYYRVRALNASTPSSYSATTAVVNHSRHQSVRVMTYNIKEARFDGTREGSGRIAPWMSARRPAAAALIKQAHPDVIGIEEGASPIGHRGGPRQVDTLRNALGGEYALARTEVPPSQAGTHRTGNYILYRKAAYRAVGKGGHWALGDRRWAAHQILRNRATGAKFLFVDAHLRQQAGRANDVRRKHETQRLVSLGHALAARHHVPVVYVGDFNSDPFDHHAFNAPSMVMKAHHVADAYNVAQHRQNARFNTANHYLRRPPHVGARIDYVYAPTGVGVKSWRLIMHVRHGSFVGTIPSDHNPLVSDLSIPF
ncbi:MAG: fibronectin type III domain-containing protein [Frankiaceae bacterium]|nr:fibronectin type III domain-containing protein [Frankiaceae bacterium]MBV9872859.1 fibronectin type III domain-containing protein [Frankiaceae bacterium]